LASPGVVSAGVRARGRRCRPERRGQRLRRGTTPGTAPPPRGGKGGVSPEGAPTVPSPLNLPGTERCGPDRV
jgi:hypothetical protein